MIELSNATVPFLYFVDWHKRATNQLFKPKWREYPANIPGGGWRERSFRSPSPASGESENKLVRWKQKTACPNPNGPTGPVLRPIDHPCTEIKSKPKKLPATHSVPKYNNVFLTRQNFISQIMERSFTIRWEIMSRIASSQTSEDLLARDDLAMQSANYNSNKTTITSSL